MTDTISSNESVSKLNKMIEELDQNLKIIDYYLETESFYNFENTSRNVRKITNFLAECSRILANIHAIRFEFTTEYQLTIYDSIKKRFDEFEEKREKMHSLQEKLSSNIKNKKDLFSNASLKFKLTPEVSNTNNNNKYDLKIIQKTDLVDLNLKTDYNEKLLDEVGMNLREIDRNVIETAASLRNQGDTLKNMNTVFDGTDNNLERANKIINNLTWGQRIQLILLHLIAILLFVGIIILLVFRVTSMNN